MKIDKTAYVEFLKNYDDFKKTINIYLKKIPKNIGNSGWINTIKLNINKKTIVANICELIENISMELNDKYEQYFKTLIVKFKKLINEYNINKKKIEDNSEILKSTEDLTNFILKIIKVITTDYKKIKDKKDKNRIHLKFLCKGFLRGLILLISQDTDASAEDISEILGKQKSAKFQDRILVFKSDGKKPIINKCEVKQSSKVGTCWFLSSCESIVWHNSDDIIKRFNTDNLLITEDGYYLEPGKKVKVTLFGCLPPVNAGKNIKWMNKKISVEVDEHIVGGANSSSNEPQWPAILELAMIKCLKKLGYTERSFDYGYTADLAAGLLTGLYPTKSMQTYVYNSEAEERIKKAENLISSYNDRIKALENDLKSPPKFLEFENFLDCVKNFRRAICAILGLCIPLDREMKICNELCDASEGKKEIKDIFYYIKNLGPYENFNWDEVNPDNFPKETKKLLEYIKTNLEKITFFSHMYKKEDINKYIIGKNDYLGILNTQKSDEFKKIWNKCVGAANNILNLIETKEDYQNLGYCANMLIRKEQFKQLNDAEFTKTILEKSVYPEAFQQTTEKIKDDIKNTKINIEIVNDSIKKLSSQTKDKYKDSWKKAVGLINKYLNKRVMIAGVSINKDSQHAMVITGVEEMNNKDKENYDVKLKCYDQQMKTNEEYFFSKCSCSITVFEPSK